MSLSMPPASEIKLPILYGRVTPISRDVHKSLRLSALAQPLSFARGTHLLPAVVDEFAAAARELPIVFLPEGDTISAVFLLALRAGKNGFVTADGMWSANYLPAYIRRYPFIMGDVEGQDPILCFDDRFEGLGPDRGDALFNADGTSSAVLEAAITFAAEFREAGLRTNSFVARLKQLGLFKSVTMDITSSKAGQATIHGLLVVDEDKLRQLPEATIAELHKTGAMPAIYAHLLSLGGIASLA